MRRPAGGVGEKEVIGPRARRHPASGNRTGAQSGQFGWHWDSLYRKPGSRLAEILRSSPSLSRFIAALSSVCSQTPSTVANTIEH